MAVGNLPIPALAAFLNSITLGNWSLVSDIIVFATEDILALATLLSVAYSLATHNDFIQKQVIAPFIPTVVALGCYVIMMVWDPDVYATAIAGRVPEVIFVSVGRSGVISALFIAPISVYVFVAFAKVWQRLPWGSWKVLGNHHRIRLAIRATFPAACTFVCFVVLRFLFDWVLDNTGIEQQASEALASLVSEGSLPAIVLSEVIVQLLWFFGAHGTDIILSSMQASGAPAVDAAGAADLKAMFTSPDFFSIFVDMGGSGTTIALLLALLVFGSESRGRQLARVSIFPVAFNINETLVFGMPVVLSPFFLIPFVVAPVVSAVVAYGAFSLGIVPPIVNPVEWTTPMLFSGYMSTGSIVGSLLQVVCVGLAFLVYAPFVRIVRSAREESYIAQFDGFRSEAACAANNESVSLVSRRDRIGDLARHLIAEINMFFDIKRIPFFLAYQPKSDIQGRVVGVEALLRWTHPRYGPIPPDILIELTDEAELSVPMGRWVVTQALEQLSQWRELGLAQLQVSINLNPHHLFLDEGFPGFLEEEFKRLSINPAFVELEITERVAVRSGEKMRRMFARLRNLGVTLSVDDMGMGYSSLTYISDYGVSVVKLDLSLVDKVAVDTQQREIVRSVIELAQQIDLAVIAEGVETREQADMLARLGCRYFQGYFFSEPLAPEDLMRYISSHGTALLEHEDRDEDTMFRGDWR